MKKIIISCFLSVLLFSVACKKDSLVDVEKTYVENGVGLGTVGFGGIILTLKPDGNADYLFSGDIMYRTTYKISGKNIILTDERLQPTKFKIMSSTTLVYEDGGKPRVLQLR